MKMSTNNPIRIQEPLTQDNCVVQGRVQGLT
jgi:hypothetical protein